MKVILIVAYLLIFDTVNHSILKNLDHYGVRGISSKWFESYLTDRKQSVLINGFNSNISTITCPSSVSIRTITFPYIHK